ADAGPEDIAERERGEHRIAARTGTDDRHPVGVRKTAPGEREGAIDAVVDVDDAPLPIQPMAVFPAIAGRAAVVHVEDGEPAAGPDLRPERQAGPCRAGRPAMAGHDER